jgi:pilus assembly protein CpaB
VLFHLARLVVDLSPGGGRGRMSKRLFSVLIFAFVVAAGASVLVYRLASRMNTSAKQETAQVMLAAHDLPVGTLIGEADLKLGAWSGSLPPNAVLKKEEAIGRGVVAGIYEGEPILESRLAVRGAGAGLAATIPPGMRAVAVRVNDVVGVAGFVVPGQRVDVLVLGTPPGSSANTSTGTITKTILQNIQVLSAGQNIQKDAEGKPATVQVVNLLVTPQQAETLSLISNDMRIQLVLRNPLDNAEVPSSGTAASSVFSGTAYKPVSSELAPRPRAVRTDAPTPVVVPATAERVLIPIMVEVYNGGKKAETQFKGQTVQAAGSEEGRK